MPGDGLMAGRTNEVLERVYIFQYKAGKLMAILFHTGPARSVPALAHFRNSPNCQCT